MAALPLDALRRAIRGEVRTDPSSLTRAAVDASHLTGRAGAVVRPRDVADVQRTVRWARRNHIALVPRAGGTSMGGESLPLAGAVVVDLSGWAGLREVSETGRWARVGPGTINRDLQEALRPHRLFFPPNPGSWDRSTIGGNVATNAAGPRSYRYGPTRHWVRGVEAVLGTGEKVAWGTRAEKRSAGPDLVSLFVASEGTLGIATEVTVRLAPLPPLREGWIVPLPPRIRLGKVIQHLRRAPLPGLSAVEYVDRTAGDALVAERGAEWAGGSGLLLLELEAWDPPEARRRAAELLDMIRGAGIRARPLHYPDADRLWTLRGSSGAALDEALGPRVREDVAVPLDKLDALLSELARIARAERAPLVLYGHLGEASLHPNFCVDPCSRAADRVRRRVWGATLALGGTVSAEHGIGRVKRSVVGRELAAPDLRVLHALKRACDPSGILNPGKLYPPARAGRGRSSGSPSGGGAARTVPG